MEGLKFLASEVKNQVKMEGKRTLDSVLAMRSEEERKFASVQHQLKELKGQRS